MSSPNFRRGLAYGIAMGLPFAAGWAVAAAVLDLGVGVVVVAAIAGWLIGTAVALGAEPGTVRRTRATTGLAIGLSLATWLAAVIGAYLLGLAILPGSTLPFVERLANAPFLESAAQQFLPFGPIELAVVAVSGWLGAR
jgi:hypothetical protein